MPMSDEASPAPASTPSRGRASPARASPSAAASAELEAHPPNRDRPFLWEDIQSFEQTVRSDAPPSTFDSRAVELLSRTAAVSRRWAASLLLAGSVAGFLSFALALLLGLSRTFSGNGAAVCFLGTHCPSGRSYQAETVSELVSLQNTPQRNIFYSFSTIACICLITSRYPWELKNVYTGDTSVGAVRAVLPPLGMLVVAMLPVVPRPSRTSLAIATVCNIHTIGAVVFVAGYLLLETWSLFKLWACLPRVERCLRAAALAGGTVCILVFEVINFVRDVSGACCRDTYMSTAEALVPMCGHEERDWNCTVALDIMEKLYGEYVLIDTASGAELLYKKISFWSETGAGVFIIFTHFIIWYYCEERQFRVPRLP